jgi:hypothetical protein
MDQLATPLDVGFGLGSRWERREATLTVQDAECIKRKGI